MYWNSCRRVRGQHIIPFSQQDNSGVGLLHPASIQPLRDTFPPAKLAIAVGVFGSAYSTGSVVGLLAGATIIQSLGWHSTFFAIVPFASVVTLMIAKFVKENKGQLTDPVRTQKAGKKRVLPSIDIKGALALSVTIIAFLLALHTTEWCEC
jgi:MFS family permease